MSVSETMMGARETVMQLYRHYQERELDKVLDGLPDDFRFEWPINPHTARYSGVSRDKTELVKQLTDLAENFEFHAYEPTNILIDGDRAAAEIELELTSKKTGHTFSAKISHFWRFKDGRPIHLVEYMDSAMMTAQSR